MRNSCEMFKIAREESLTATKGVCQAVITKESCAEYARNGENDYYVGEGIKDAAKSSRRRGLTRCRVAFGGLMQVALFRESGNLLEIAPSLHMLIQKSSLCQMSPRLLVWPEGEASIAIASDLAVDLAEEYLQRGDKVHFRRKNILRTQVSACYIYCGSS
ncbi:MAG: hypothetical protein ACLT8I_23620 [Blautia faecis]